MNDSTPDQQQPRMPGVKYAKETRYRAETTTIDGVSSTRSVPYEVLVPVPPRDWDEVILRGVIGLAMGITSLAVVGTTASVGGQLSELLNPVISYGVGVIFSGTWLAAMGLEWVQRTDPKRAKPARICGWIFLVISMLAVFSYGHAHGQDIAGGVGACLDLLAKGLWALLIHTHRVPLSEGVQGWLIDQEGTAAGRALLSRKIARLNRMEAYQRAVGGREYQAAGAIITTEEPVPALPAPVIIAEPVPAVPVAPVQPPVPPVEPLSGQTGQVPAPIVPQVPVPPVSGQGAPVSGQTGGQVQPPVQPPVSQIGGSIAGTVRKLIADRPEWEHDDQLDALTAAVAAVHGADPKLKETVRRSRDRDINKRRVKKVS